MYSFGMERSDMMENGSVLFERPRFAVTIVLLLALLVLAVGDVAAWGHVVPNGSTVVSGP